ncbi:LEVG family PEP-CTERM protein [Nostoc sp. UHCC 0702]|nr:LEVG family PEP-CTERM protein [Nostoc sp. UHCC 0702]
MPKFKVISRLIAASTISIGFLSIASTAHAVNLTPQEEGEIKLTNLECLNSISGLIPKCLDTSSGKYGYTVTSLNFDPQFSASRLFADKRNTPNDYSQFGLQFLAQDAGTNTALDIVWLRPVAYSPDVEKKDSPKSSTTKQTIDAPPGASIGTVTVTAPTTTVTTTAADGKKTIKNITVETTTVTKQTKVKGVTKLIQEISTKTITQTTTITPGKPAEKGQLEVGKFQFDFKNPLSGIRFNFFDIEDSNYSGILSYTNSQGKTISIKELLTGKEDGNVQSPILNDVQSFVVQLGNPGFKYGYDDTLFNTGDGVNLQIETVPEPATMAGLGALAMLGIMSRRQRKNKTA